MCHQKIRIYLNLRFKMATLEYWNKCNKYVARGTDKPDAHCGVGHCPFLGWIVPDVEGSQPNGWVVSRENIWYRSWSSLRGTSISIEPPGPCSLSNPQDFCVISAPNPVKIQSALWINMAFQISFEPPTRGLYQRQIKIKLHYSPVRVIKESFI
jgi:hypothetical protein